MKVWVVSYEHGECQAVFSSEEKAKEWAERNKGFTGWPKFCWIDDYEVDPS